jgi:hypothetical protein
MSTLIIPDRFEYAVGLTATWAVGQVAVDTALDYGLTLAGTDLVEVVNTDPDKNTIFDCAAAGLDGVEGFAWLKYGYDVEGDFFGTFHTATTLAYAVGLSGIFARGQAVTTGTTLDYGYRLRAEQGTLEAQDAWIYWSDIGNLDFTINRSNVAGKMPLKHAGFVYQLRQLDNSVIAYCANGIVQLNPKENIWGSKSLLPIGLIGRDAQAGLVNNSMHWFIDESGKLWEISQAALKPIGYQEFFSAMTNPVMSLDEKNELIYICDGTYGYVYSYKYQQLASGPTNVSSISLYSGDLYLYAPATVVVPAGSFSTSILDFGTRNKKTLFQMEIGCNLASAVTGKISFRLDKSQAFSETPTATFTPHGIAYLPCFGREFILHLTVATREVFHLDWFKVSGVIHGFNFLDTVRQER